MASSFSADVLRRIQMAQRTLLSPLDYGSRRAWHDAVADRLKTLMGCDCVYVIVGAGPDTTLATPHLGPSFGEETEEYMQSLPPDQTPLPARLQRKRIRRGSGAYHELHLAERVDIQQSPYYQDVARSYGLGYATGMSVVTPDGEVTFCTIFRRADAPGYSVDATRRLSVLVPALEAGLDHRRRLTRLQGRLRTVVDTLDDAVVVFSVDGRERHRNAALVALLRDEPDRDTLMRAAGGLALDVRAVQQSGAVEPAPVERVVEVASGAYRLRATGAGRLLDERPTVLVTVVREAPFPPPQALRRRWALTPREAEVALHVARGATNAAIADRLSISPHTARHHVSSVLRKLGVDARTEVAAALTPPHGGGAAGGGAGPAGCPPPG